MTIGATTTPPSEGSGVTKLYLWKRDGDCAILQGAYVQTGTGSAGTGFYLLPLVTGMTADTSKVTVSTAVGGGGAHVIGTGYCSNSSTGGASTYINRANMYNSTNFVLQNQETASTVNMFGSTSIQLSAANVSFGFNIRVPISGWEP